MTYSVESVFDYVANAVDSAVQGVRIVSHREPVAKSLPALYLYEMNRTRPQRYATLANDDVQWESTYEAEIYVNDLDGARTNAYSILYAVESAFKTLGYFETFCEPIDNIDPTLFRINARFSRQIGIADAIPSTT